MELEFGIKETSRSVSMGIRPALSPEEMSGLSQEEVIVRIDRRYVTKAYRLWPVPQLATLPDPAYEFEMMGIERPEPLWGSGYAQADDLDSEPNTKTGRPMAGG